MFSAFLRPFVAFETLSRVGSGFGRGFGEWRGFIVGGDEIDVLRIGEGVGVIVGRWLIGKNLLAVVADVGVVNELDFERGARGGVVVTDAVEDVVDTDAVLVRDELVVDDVDVDELEAVSADDDEASASVTAPRKHEENVAPEVDNP